MNTQSIRLQTDLIEFRANNNNYPSTLSGAQAGRRPMLTVVLMLLAIAVCSPRNGVAQAALAPGSHGGSAGTQAVSHILIPAPLASSLDSKKLKAGDEVVLKTAANIALTDGTTIPRGTKVVGHVTEAKARSKGDAQSSLALTFDRLNFPDGKTLAISGLIRAVGPDLSAASPGGGGVVYSGDVARTTYMPSVSSNSPSVPLLNEQSVGVLGIKNLQLAADGVLTSDSKSVKLDSGAQILLQVQVTAGE